MFILRLTQSLGTHGGYRVEVSLGTPGGVPQVATSEFEFRLRSDDRERQRWYLEDYLEYPLDPAPQIASGVERRMADLGCELFSAVFGSREAAGLWAGIRDRLPDTRVEIETDVAGVMDLPWELLRDQRDAEPVALRVASFARVNHSAAGPVPPRESFGGPLRVLLVICRPSGGADVPFRSVAGQLARLRGPVRSRLTLDVLRPPTFARLAAVLEQAALAGEPYHVVHFDGHGAYLDAAKAGNASRFLFPPRRGRRGYLVFEDASMPDHSQLVDGAALGAELVRSGVSVLVLNACRSAYVEAPAQPQPDDAANAQAHERAHGYGSLALEVSDAGVPGVVAMRYSVYVVTVARFMTELYDSMLAGHALGAAATAGRRRLAAQPDRTIAFDPVPLQDWSVPVVYENVPLTLFPGPAVDPVGVAVADPGESVADDEPPAEDHLPRSPEVGFFGRDETLLALDRAFDTHFAVLLHAYAGSGKTSTAAEFARWYAATGGLGDPRPATGRALFTSFERYTPLARLLNQLSDEFPALQTANGGPWQTLSEQERRQASIEFLRSTPVLWIWDNVDPVTGFPAGGPSAWAQEEQDGLVGFLRDLVGSQAKVLLTSRRDERAWLGHLPCRVVLPPMPMRERFQLMRALAERAGRRVTDVRDWRPLLRYTAGNPLTVIILVGQALRMGLTTSTEIEDFVAGLRSGEAGIVDDVSQGRSASLAASLTYGFNHLLTEQERARLAVLHLFQEYVSVFHLQMMAIQKGEARVAEMQGVTYEVAAEMLDRSSEIGLLDRIDERWYRIHPALPWFFAQLFQKTYGSAGQPGAQRVIRAYVHTCASFASGIHDAVGEGKSRPIDVMALDEANVLHALELARRNGWWDLAVGCMQGLRSLYGRLGRRSEWARLVSALVPDIVDPATGGPLPGRDDQWSLLIGYRAGLARDRHDWAEAERLLIPAVEWLKREAVGALAAPVSELAELDRQRIAGLASDLQNLGDALREQGKANCVDYYEEAADLAKRLGRDRLYAIIAFNLGHAYKGIPALLDLDQAERWYRVALDSFGPDDDPGRAATLRQLGTVAYERYFDLRAAGQRQDVLQRQLDDAITRYTQALDLTPENAPNERAGIYQALGIVYIHFGEDEKARQLYQKAIKLFEDIGDRYGAGVTRLSVASDLGRNAMHFEAALYVSAALRDFQSLGTDGVAAGAGGALRVIEQLQSHPAMLAAAEDAVSTVRALAATNLKAGRSNLAQALSVLAMSLLTVGRLEDALATAGEAVPLLRALAESDPAIDRPRLATLLQTLGSRLAKASRHRDAVVYTEQAVSAYRSLARTDPATYQAKLARSLDDLSAGLSLLGRGDEAQSAGEEALTIFRALAEADPATHQADLAASLSNLGVRLSDAGNYETALAYGEEAVALHRVLAEADPLAHLPNTATSLLALAGRRAEAGLFREAVLAAEEGVGLARVLADTDPDRHRPLLAVGLNSLAGRLSDVGRYEDALAPAQEALSIRRTLADTDGTTYLTDVATSLHNLGGWLDSAGRAAEALPYVEEATAIRRRLATADPTRHRANLASSLNSLSVLLASAGRHEQAQANAEEAVALLRELWTADPALHRSDLAMSLHNLAARAAESKRWPDALAHAAEAATHYRELAQIDPVAHRPHLASALSNLAAFTASAGHPDDAINIAEESVTLRRALAKSNLAVQLPELASALQNLAVFLASTARYEEALSCAEEALGIYQRLAETNPAAQRANLADSLSALAAHLDRLGRGGEITFYLERALADLANPVDRAYVLLRRCSSSDRRPLPDMFADVATALDMLRDEEPAPNITSWAHTVARRVRHGDSQAFDAAWKRRFGAVPAWLTFSDERTQVLGTWIRTATWAESKAYLSEHPELLDEQTDGALNELQLVNPDNSTLDLHVRIIAVARQLGLDSAYNSIVVREAIRAWIGTRTWTESAAYLRDHEAELLSEAAREALRNTAAEDDSKPDYALHWALQDLAVLGRVDEGYAYLMLDPAGRGATLAALLSDTDMGVLETFAILAAQSMSGNASDAHVSMFVATVGLLSGHVDAETALAPARSAQSDLTDADALAWSTRVSQLAQRHPDRGQALLTLNEVLAQRSQGSPPSTALGRE